MLADQRGGAGNRLFRRAAGADEAIHIRKLQSGTGQRIFYGARAHERGGFVRDKMPGQDAGMFFRPAVGQAGAPVNFSGSHNCLGKMDSSSQNF